MENRLDYPRLWKTLLRAGLKETFSTVRLEFFMSIAKDGPRIYNGKEDLDEIIETSKVFKIRPEMVEYARLAIGEEDKFKHYYYETSDGSICIEYFANVTRGISKEFIDHASDGKETDYNIDGNCTSWVATDVIKVHHDVDEDDDKSMEDISNLEETQPATQTITVHFIIISDNECAIDPETYPMIIKHELTHACLFDIRKNIRCGYYDNYRIPALWTDEQIREWEDDIKYLSSVLESEDEDATNFLEFVCEFLMYESDGQIKVKNPVIETRAPKNVRSDTKPKITYRNVTPFDRFQEVIDTFEGSYKDINQPILETLRPFYNDYDAFLEDIRM